MSKKPICSFIKDGQDKAQKILEDMRKNMKFDPEAVANLVNGNLAVTVADGFTVDDSQIFASKRDFVEYFQSVAPKGFFDGHRTDIGLWTWLAFFYARQLVKKNRKGDQIVADECWIFDPNNYRSSRRHLLFGPLLLHESLSGYCDEIQDIVFSPPLNEGGGFTDAITYKKEGTQSPAILTVAAWLYHDPNAPKKLKSGATSQDQPGTIRQLLQVSAQLGMTRDFYEQEDAKELWKLLPPQFDRFKAGSSH